MSTLTFKHSGTTGDLIYSLPLVKYFGGGEFYLHLNQVDWIGRYYYGAKPNPFHQGRMRVPDFDFIAPLMEQQDYISKFEILDPKITEITHNLDRFRPAFVSHPGNYVDIYAKAFGITDSQTQAQLRSTAWLTVANPKTIEGRDVIVNRTDRWISEELNPQWSQWRSEGIEQRAVFIGLEDEYLKFKAATGWDIPYQKTRTLLEVAEYIAGADQFIGNQSAALAVAIGLGHPCILCEARRDLPRERNECHFPNQTNIQYF